MSLILDVSNDVVDELNSEFAGTLTAVRAYVPQFDLPDFTAIKCTVVPKDKKKALISQSYSQDDVQIDVAVQKNLFNTVVTADGTFQDDVTEVDPLTILMEQIENFFMYRQLTEVAAVAIESKYVPIYSPDHIREKRIFTGVLNFTFRCLGGLAMSNFIGRKIALTATFTPISGTQLIAIVEITAPPSNVQTMYIQGDDGVTLVPMVPGEYHVLRRVDLNKILVKGTPGDFVTVVGGTT